MCANILLDGEAKRCPCGNELEGRRTKWCSVSCSADEARRLKLLTIFAITPVEYDLMLDYQDGRCATCHKPPRPGKRLVVDHDHKSGFIRGLLCAFCNLRAVGKATDPALHQAVANYLTDPPARHALGRNVVAPGRPRKRRTTRRVNR